LLVDTLTPVSKMELPKIRNIDLPKELREVLGDGDAEFDALIDPDDFIDVQLNPDAFYEERHGTALKLLEVRKSLNERKRDEIQGHYQGGEENNQESEEAP